MAAKDTRDEVVIVRMTADEKEAFMSESKKLGMKLSEFIRHLFAKYRGH